MRTESLFKHFMITQVSHLPVLGEDGKLEGFLSKEKLQIEMADFSRSSEELESIPQDYLDSDLSESVLNYFQNFSKLPVLDREGKRVEVWDKPRLLSEYSRMVARKEEMSPSAVSSIQDREEVTGETQNNLSPVHWYMQLILESFGDPLFSTDINGNMVFYNDRFEKDILSQGSFRNSVSFAERYLRDVNRDLFAAFIKANDLDLNANQDKGRVLQTILPNLGYLLRIVTLLQNEKIVGYLYHFQALKSRIQSQNSEGVIFPSLEEAFANQMPLEIVLNETESFYIYQSLVRNQFNVSHTADELGIPRSTLQNRMKFLDLDQKFAKDKEKTIPRKRKASHEPPSSPEPKSQESKEIKKKPSAKRHTRVQTKTKTIAKPKKKTVSRKKT